MKINQILIIIGIANGIAGLLAAGCSKTTTMNYTYIPTSSVPAETDRGEAQAQLAQTVVNVDTSLQELSAIQMSTHPAARMSPLDPLSLGMTTRASLDWNGPVEPLLHKIARATHYKLRILGKEPATPVLVSVIAVNQPLANILRNVTYQVQAKADVVTYPRQRVIELRYHTI